MGSEGFWMGGRQVRDEASRYGELDRGSWGRARIYEVGVAVS